MCLLERDELGHSWSVQIYSISVVTEFIDLIKFNDFPLNTVWR